MKEIKPSDTARISGGATTLGPESEGLDPMPLARAEPIPPDLAPSPEPVPTVSGKLPGN